MYMSLGLLICLGIFQFMVLDSYTWLAVLVFIFSQMNYVILVPCSQMQLISASGMDTVILSLVSYLLYARTSLLSIVGVPYELVKAD